MAKCDLCDGTCSHGEMSQLRDIYQTSGVVDVCPSCIEWANTELDQIRSGNAPELKRRIAARRNRPRSWWRRLLGL